MEGNIPRFFDEVDEVLLKLYNKQSITRRLQGLEKLLVRLSWKRRSAVQLRHTVHDRLRYGTHAIGWLGRVVECLRASGECWKTTWRNTSVRLRVHDRNLMQLVTKSACGTIV